MPVRRTTSSGSGGARILEPGIALVHGVKAALRREVEGQDGELDDLVARGIEAGRLDVDDETAEASETLADSAVRF
jgi:hypothetical protein